LRRASVLAALAAFLASCTNAVTDPDLQAGVPGYNASSSMSGDGVQAQVVANTGVAVDDEETTGTTASTAENPGEAGALPQQVAALPTSNPATPASDPTAQPTVTDEASTKAATPGGEAETATQTAGADPATAGDGSVLTAAAPIEEPAKPKGVFAAFFSGGGNKSSNGISSNRDRALPTTNLVAKSAPKPTAVKASASEAEPAEIDFAAFEQPTKRTSASSGGENALPGVRQTALFEIKRRSGLDDDADVDIYEEEDHGPIQMASAAGMARLAPNGLAVQTESVDVACLKPSLVRVLKQMERHYGKKMVVTSGYRNPQRNRRARGAKNSLHMYCAAADIQIPGVGKWELASYARTMGGRGGVGTYCHTNSVHVDVGPERDWNWRCRGRRR